MTSIKEKQIDKVLDRIIGDGDDTLKIITKLAMMNKELSQEMIDTIDMIKTQNEQDITELNKEMTMTLDVGGNLVLLDVSANILLLEKASDIPYRLSIGKT